MTQSMENYQMDSELKKKSEIAAEPFYSETNMEHLRRGIAALNDGHGVEHELIEDNVDGEER